MSKLAGTKGTVEALREIFKEISNPRDFEVGDIVVDRLEILESRTTRLSIVTAITVDYAYIIFLYEKGRILDIKRPVGYLRKATQEELGALPWVEKRD